MIDVAPKTTSLVKSSKVQIPGTIFKVGILLWGH